MVRVIFVITGTKKARKVAGMMSGITQSAVVELWKLTYKARTEPSELQGMTIRQQAEWLLDQGALGKTMKEFDSLPPLHRNGWRGKDNV